MGLFSNSSNTPGQSGPNPHIKEYQHLAHLDRADEALKLLHQVASTARPIMRKRNWHVGTLAEFLPDNPRLQGSSSQLLCSDTRLEHEWRGDNKHSLTTCQFR